MPLSGSETEDESGAFPSWIGGVPGADWIGGVPGADWIGGVPGADWIGGVASVDWLTGARLPPAGSEFAATLEVSDAVDRAAGASAALLHAFRPANKRAIAKCVLRMAIISGYAGTLTAICASYPIVRPINMSVESSFLEFSVNKLMQFTSRIEVCLGKLTQEQIWIRGGKNENAVGNLVVHLTGNVRQ